MQKLLKFAVPVLGLALIAYSCQKDRTDLAAEVVSQEVIDQLTDMGFNPDGIERIEEGYRIERDIIITDEFLQTKSDRHFVPNLEQYSTNNLVNPSLYPNGVIDIWAPTSGRDSYSAGMIAGLDEAISRYNARNLAISFRRVSSESGADITMTRLRKGEERRGILGSAGFPSSSGEVYGEIKMSGILESAYGLSTAGIATIIAHEIGHCIGFRHTDFFNRSISCGSGGNEGDGGVGANHIPGTPTGASLSDASFMLSCTDGSDRPFNQDDRTALDYLY